MDNPQKILETLQLRPSQRKILEALLAMSEENFTEEIVLFTKWKDDNFTKNDYGHYRSDTINSNVSYNIEGLYLLFKNL